MLRAESIIRFEQFYLAGGIVFELNLAVSSLPLWQDDNAPWGGLGHLLGGMALRGSICFLFWFLVIGWRSAVAKWLLVALDLIGLFDVMGSMSSSSAVTTSDGLILLGRALILVAIAYLFRQDAVEWLRSDVGAEAVERLE